MARTFLLLALLAVVNVVLELYPNLSLCRLVPDKRVLEKLLCVRSLVVVLDQNSLDEAVELLGPLL